MSRELLALSPIINILSLSAFALLFSTVSIPYGPPVSYSRRHPMRRRPPVGFTLVDILVAIAILSMMMSILLPAIQSAREAARQIECKNNIKQLALACHGHHDVHRYFPTGGWGWYWVGDADRGFGREQPGGWIFNLLPYFEQYSLYGLASDGDPDLLTRAQRVGAVEIIRTPLSIINCPARRPNSLFPMTANQGGNIGYFNSMTPNEAGRSDYAINSGHVYSEWPQKMLGQGPRSYADERVWTANRYWGGELFEYCQGHKTMTGISFERSQVSICNIEDGLSQTYLLGEKYIAAQHYESGSSQGDNETWCTGFNNDNYRSTGRLVGGEVLECSPVPDWADHIKDPDARFGSAHPNGWNVAFCDGSVHTLSFTIDWQIHRDFGNRMDGIALIPAP